MKEEIKNWIKESNKCLSSTRFKVLNKYIYYILILYFILSLFLMLGGLIAFLSFLQFVKTQLPELNNLILENKELIINYIK